MHSHLPLFLLGAAAALGLLLGSQFLRGRRNPPMLIGLHLLLGGAGLETLAMLLRGAPDGSPAPAGSLAVMSAGLLVLAMVCGLSAPVLARYSRLGANATVAMHASLAAGGIALLIGWLVRT